LKILFIITFLVDEGNLFQFIYKYLIIFLDLSKIFRIFENDESRFQGTTQVYCPLLGEIMLQIEGILFI